MSPASGSNVVNACLPHSQTYNIINNPDSKKLIILVIMYVKHKQMIALKLSIQVTE